MKDLHVIVNDEIATYQKRDGDIVCGNKHNEEEKSGYQIKFTFDTAWDAHDKKIARFIWGGHFQDVEFTGDTCPVPIISGATLCEVGVYAGDLHTTTSAFIGCKPSILCQSATPSVENDGYYANEARKYAEEAKEAAAATESLPSPNLVNINDTESWPFGISETEAVKGLYSWVDSEGYAHIKGTTTEGCSVFFMFDTDYTTFEPGTYYIGFDDVLRRSSNRVTIKFGDSSTEVSLNDKTPRATVTLTESASLNKVDVVFIGAGAAVDFKGHCWITKDEPFDFFVPKGGTYKKPITPAKKEDLEKLSDLNILGIFDSIGGVGDSLMSGYINTTDSSIGSDTVNYSKSWLTQVSKIIGVDITHYCYAGATTKNWLQNQEKHYENIVTKPCDAYFIALGTNDSSDWANIPVGTAADMGTDTESFYGMYAKVIARIREANPRAPIFMLSMYWTGFPTYNAAIEAMSKVTDNAYYIDITDMNDKYPQYRQGYHFNAIGYYYIAKSVIERTSKVILDNYQDFNNLGIDASGSGEETPEEPNTPTYTNVLDTVGYQEGYRINSSGKTVERADRDSTGFIKACVGDTLYFKNIESLGDDYGSVIAHYTSNSEDAFITGKSYMISSASSNTEWWENGALKSHRISAEDTEYVRFCFVNIDETSIITINEPIE